MTTSNKIRLFVLVGLISSIFSFGSAAYEVTIVLKFPFLSCYPVFDSGGVGMGADSLVRYREFEAILYRRTGGQTPPFPETLIFEDTTNDSDCAVLLFEYWQDRTEVDTSNIDSLILRFPDTYKANQIGDGYTFEQTPYQTGNILAVGTRGETIPVVLPLTVNPQEFTIGSGPFHYDFVVLSDCHIADGKKKIGIYRDFGTEGWDDEDNDPNETT